MNLKKQLILVLVFKHFRRKKNVFRRRMQTFLIFSYLFMRHQTNYDMSSLLSKLKASMKRNYWMMEYHQGWFEKMLENESGELFKDLWTKQFRFFPTTFNYIIDQGNLESQDTNLREAATIKKRATCSSWHLALGNSYRTIGKLSGLVTSTVPQICKEFCSDLRQKLSRFIKSPKSRTETATEIFKFKEFTDCKIPQTVGTIDGTHIEINSPGGESRIDYFSRKTKIFNKNTSSCWE